MYILSHMSDKLYAVGDTKDNVLELISHETYQKYINMGVSIEPWTNAKSFITSAMIRNCGYQIYRKMRYTKDDSEMLSYLQCLLIYPLTDIYTSLSTEPMWDSNCRVFNYIDSLELCYFLIRLKNGYSVLLRVLEDYSVVTVVIPFPVVTSYYPSGSGRLYNTNFRRNGISAQSLPEYALYCSLYSPDFSKMYLYNIFDMEKYDFTPIVIDLPNKEPIK